MVSRLLLIFLVSAVLAACGGAEAPSDPAEPSGELPSLAMIGGVRDVWPFEFGLDADREAVRSVAGDPIAVTASGTMATDAGPEILRWEYDGVQMTFLIDSAAEREYLISVRISHPDVPLRGGLSIGMPLDEAVELLGEPRVVSNESRVYFYRDTTIELIAPGDVVQAVTLARALP